MCRQHPRFSDPVHIRLDSELSLKAVATPDVFLKCRTELNDRLRLNTEVKLTNVCRCACLSVIDEDVFTVSRIYKLKYSITDIGYLMSDKRSYFDITLAVVCLCIRIQSNQCSSRQDDPVLCSRLVRMLVDSPSGIDIDVSDIVVRGTFKFSEEPPLSVVDITAVDIVIYLMRI